MKINQIFDYIIPIFTVLLAGLIAIYQMRQNIKLNAKLKFKEEFREKLNKFISEAKNLSHSSILLELDNQNIDRAKYLFDNLSEFEASFFALDLLLKRNEDKRVIELINLKNKIKDFAFGKKEKMSHKDSNSNLRDFYYKAKEIYNDDKFIKENIV